MPAMTMRSLLGALTRLILLCSCLEWKICSQNTAQQHKQLAATNCPDHAT
jgi:hypothetical protein